MVRCVTGLWCLRVSKPAIYASFDRDHSKFLPRTRRAQVEAYLLRKHPLTSPNGQRHMLTRQSGPPRPPQRSSTLERRVKIDQVGMSGGFCHIVLRLVENRVQGHRPALHGCIRTGSPPPGEQHIDKTVGAQPVAPTEEIRKFRGRKLLGKGQVGMTPKRVGLYNPAFEHDSCGVAMVVDMHGRRSRDIVDKAITALLNLEHRGAQGAEPRSGDGAGILIQVPDAFLRDVVDFELPAAGSYATGIAFLPQSSRDAAAACDAVEKIAEAEGLQVLGWRPVPTDDSSLGALSRDAMPTFRQVFLAGASAMELERRAYLVRKRAEHELGTKGPGQDGPGRETVYFPSLSGQTLVYKGMLTTPQLKAFYLDLQDQRLTSALGILHSRFSTHTLPSWPLAHPSRRIAHNGEINTVTGNENWMRAREALIRNDIFGADVEKLFPICTPGASDPAPFDEVPELLHLAGRSRARAVLMMIPEAWERHESMVPARRAFYQYHASLMEPWDGPASMTFTDGTVVGAVLDRNGLRPSRIWVTADGLVVMASEAGVLDLGPSTGG